MNAPLSTTSPTPAPDAPNPIQQLPDYATAMAARLGLEIVWNDDGFGVMIEDEVHGGEMDEIGLLRWMIAFQLGMENLDEVLLAELVAAEQIIQIMGAQMTDAQRLAASESLVAIGFPVEGSARCQPRRAAITAARKASAA